MVPKKALIAMTSAHAPLYPDGKETGLFVTEALHPFEVFRASGFEVDLVSETGSYQANWLSQQPEWLSEKDNKVWEDHSSKSIIAGKKVTGFTTKGEEEEGVLETIQSWKRPTIEMAAKSAGATYVAPPGPWDAFTYTDGNIVTSANPASANVTAEDAVKAFQKL
ncbi:hypothetical protein IFR05_000121 [Cadophora sp. M221]|nr:hypothetical protein IFR05_000121 [Cadophora sp. M221]